MGLGFPCEGGKGGAELDEEFSSFPTRKEITLLIKQALPTGITNVLYASAMVCMHRPSGWRYKHRVRGGGERFD